MLAGPIKGGPAFLRDGAGGQWDPEVVAALLGLALEGHLRERTGRDPDGVLASWTGDDGSGPPSVAPSRPVIFVRNYLDGNAAERLLVKVDALLRRGRKHLVLDMKEVSALEPASAQMLLQMHEHVQAGGGRMILRDVTVPALALFHAEGIADLLPIDQQRHSS